VILAQTQFTARRQVAVLHGQVSLHLGDSLNHYAQWDTPTVIVSDGAYGILANEK
jgi:uncharacterized membrane protein